MPQSEPTHPYQSETIQLKSLIESLERSKATLAADLKHEERKTGVFEAETPCYSPLAKQMRLRRENISSTIAVLAERPQSMLGPSWPTRRGEARTAVQ